RIWVVSFPPAAAQVMPKRVYVGVRGGGIPLNIVRRPKQRIRMPSLASAPLQKMGYGIQLGSSDIRVATKGHLRVEAGFHELSFCSPHCDPSPRTVIVSTSL